MSALPTIASQTGAAGFGAFVLESLQTPVAGHPALGSEHRYTVAIGSLARPERARPATAHGGDSAT